MSQGILFQRKGIDVAACRSGEPPDSRPLACSIILSTSTRFLVVASSSDKCLLVTAIRDPSLQFHGSASTQRINDVLHEAGRIRANVRLTSPRTRDE